MSCSVKFREAKTQLSTTYDDGLESLVIPEAVLTEGDGSGRQLLHYCTSHASVVKLIEMKASLAVKDKYGMSPLHLFAHAMGERELVAILSDERIVRHQDLFAVDSFGNTLLHTAVSKSVVFRAALQRIQDMETMVELLSIANNDGDTCLHRAAVRGTNDSVQCVRCIANAAPQLMETQNRKGRTALHLASEFGCRDAVQVLLASGAVVGALDGCGWTPLHCAVLGAWPQHESHVGVAAMLLDSKANVNATENAHSWTPLHVATDAVAVAELLKRGADIKALDESGQNIMHLCAPEVARELIQSCSQRDIHALLTAADKHLRVPLHVASSTAKVDVLARACPEVINACDRDGKTPLDLAEQSLRVEAALELRNEHAAVRDCDLSGPSFWRVRLVTVFCVALITWKLMRRSNHS